MDGECIREYLKRYLPKDLEVLSVYYDETRNYISRPGFTSFTSNRKYDKCLGEIETKGIR